MKVALETMLSLTIVLVSVQLSFGSYSLSTKQCKYAVKTIGKILDTKSISEDFLKGTFVSPRCELRRIRQLQGGLKTAFLLRSLDISNRKRWHGNYYFYHDQDCRNARYGLELHGNPILVRNKKITFNISSVNIAVYDLEYEKKILSKYNKSCPGTLVRSRSANPIVYTADRRVPSSKECLKTLGLDPREFVNAFFETHEPAGSRADELVQTAADLLKTSMPVYIEQTPLVSYDTRMCLTCAKMGLAKLTHPPKLNNRNSTSLDGVWGSFRCKKEARSFYSARIDKFDGNNFEFIVYQMDHNSPIKCESPLFELRTSGTFRKVGDSSQVPGGVVYELLVKRAYMTLFTKAMANVYNINAGSRFTKCGEKTWEKGKTQDLLATNGCDLIGYTINPKKPELVLIRTVHDENRNEMYIGTDSSVESRKSGPVEYNYVTQDCATFPIEMTTTPGPTESTTIQTEPSEDKEKEEEESDIINVVVKNIHNPTAAAITINALSRTLLVCLVFLQAVRLL